MERTAVVVGGGAQQRALPRVAAMLNPQHPGMATEVVPTMQPRGAGLSPTGDSARAACFTNCTGGPQRSSPGTPADAPPAGGRDPLMNYAGPGQGDYVQETTYRYVGNGAGEFDFIPKRATKASVYVLGFLLIAAIIGAAYMLVPASGIGKVMSARSGAVGSIKPPFDCFGGESAEWDGAKKAWCCHAVGAGCHPATDDTGRADRPGNGGVRHHSAPAQPTAAEPRTTPTAPAQPVPAVPAVPPLPPVLAIPPVVLPHFDCDQGLGNWQAAWSVPRKDWCCAHMARGCTVAGQAPQLPAHQVDYDCGDGFTTWRASWPTAKQLWCCAHEGRGCGGGAPGAAGGSAASFAGVASPTASMPFDCNAGFSRWELGWSTPKKNWCCAHGGHGCTRPPPMPTTSAPFECNDEGAEDTWPATKSAWCCQRVSKGCTTTQAPHNCDGNVAGWSADKRKYCCKETGDRGCDSHAEEGIGVDGKTPPYDCGVGLNQCKARWSVKKKVFCCEDHDKRQCPDFSCPAAGADGSAGPAKAAG